MVKRPHARPRRSILWLGAAIVPVLGVLGIWVAIRALPGFGPALADGLRGILGSKAVATLEEVSAGVEDRVRLTVGSSQARGLSELTPPELNVLAQAVPAPLGEPTFRLPSVGAMFPDLASPDDGEWQPVPVASPGGTPIYRTLVHPDPRRAYAELFVFAVDLSQVELHFSAGSIEPKAAPGARRAVNRSGRVHADHADTLIAAFNGGFKSEHGHYGMMVEGVEVSPPLARSCTVAADGDNSLFIGTWSQLQPVVHSLSSWRQTPACMAESGTLHPGLRGDSTKWGATIDGKTVIRRSAIGLDRDRKTLFVGISNATTARALAAGMLHVGAHDVAQLDVNHDFPKFVLYARDSAGGLTAFTAVKGFSVEPDAYVGRPSTRDFFYVTARRR